MISSSNESSLNQMVLVSSYCWNVPYLGSLTVIRRIPLSHPLRLQLPHFRTSPVNNNYSACFDFLISGEVEVFMGNYLFLEETLPSFQVYVSNVKCVGSN
jgi:hypothetical protein